MEAANDWKTRYVNHPLLASRVGALTDQEWSRYVFLRENTPAPGTPLSRQAYKGLTGGGRGRNAKKPSFALYKQLLLTDWALSQPIAGKELTS
jgi:hypothetical protein